MQFTVEKETLLKSLSHMQGVVDRKCTMPILSNINIETTEGHIIITATDMDLQLVDQITADIKVAGDTTIPAHLLHDIVKKLPAKSVISFKLKDNGVMAISCGKSKFSLPCLSSDNFPSTGGGDFDVKFTIDAIALRLMIDKVKFAMSTEETRYYLNGIYLHSFNGQLRSVATDGSRLSVMGISLPSGSESLEGVIIPRKAVNEIRKLIDTGTDNVNISISKSKIEISYHNITLTSKLIDGTYPDYARIIPTTNTNKMVVNASLLSKSIDIASIATSQSKGIKLSLTGGDLEISSTGENDGTQSSDEIEVEHNGVDLLLGFNSVFLKDAISAISDDNATFLFNENPNFPAIILDESTPGATFVVMPMRVWLCQKLG